MWYWFIFLLFNESCWRIKLITILSLRLKTNSKKNTNDELKVYFKGFEEEQDLA